VGAVGAVGAVGGPPDGPGTSRSGPLAAPLDVAPRSGVGWAFLLVLFVLLTVAAVVVGYLVFAGGVGGAGPNRTAAGEAAGSVAGREDLLTGWTAAAVPPVTMITAAGVR